MLNSFWKSFLPFLPSFHHSTFHVPTPGPAYAEIKTSTFFSDGTSADDILRAYAASTKASPDINRSNDSASPGSYWCWFNVVGAFFRAASTDVIGLKFLAAFSNGLNHLHGTRLSEINPMPRTKRRLQFCARWFRPLGLPLLTDVPR